MDKHTPGPWEIQRDSGLHIYITQPSDAPNRVPGYYAEIRRFNTDSEQVEANAQLIAASPNLLKVLETILECGSVNDQYWVNDARAAIAKAKGES